MAVCDTDAILCGDWVLLQVLGEAAIAVGQRAKRRLDASAQRQRLEILGVRLTGRDLDIEIVVPGCLRHPRADGDAIDLGALDHSALLGPGWPRCGF